MDVIEKIKVLNNLSYDLYDACKNERHVLFQEEFNLERTSLGEMEVHVDCIAGVVFSILKGNLPIEHLEILEKASLEKGIPNLFVFERYPAIKKYVENWEALRVLCIQFIRDKNCKYGVKYGVKP